jgi:chromosomal replication initiation ATPase DnaA
MKANQLTYVTNEVATAHGLTVSALRGPKRAADLVAARHEIWARVHDEHGYSLPRIGRFFGRHHSTILSGVQKHRYLQERA